MSELFDPARRRELARLIDGAVAAVLADYERFVHDRADLKPAEFGRRHNAAKAALGHLEALARLYGQLAAPPEPGGNGACDGRSEAELLADARARLGAIDAAHQPAAATAEETSEGP